LQVLLDKSDRLALHLELPALVLGEDRFRAGSERAVIEEMNARIEKELIA
jgi:hypothetical protein